MAREGVLDLRRGGGYAARKGVVDLRGAGGRRVCGKCQGEGIRGVQGESSGHCGEAGEVEGISSGPPSLPARLLYSQPACLPSSPAYLPPCCTATRVRSSRQYNHPQGVHTQLGYATALTCALALPPHYPPSPSPPPTRTITSPHL